MLYNKGFTGKNIVVVRVSDKYIIGKCDQLDPQLYFLVSYQRKGGEGAMKKREEGGP